MPCAATMDDTMDVTSRITYVYHMIFRGYDTHIIHSIEFYGVSRRATYVYIPHRFKPPYNANKSIFVYLHGIFTSLYIHMLPYIHNKQ